MNYTWDSGIFSPCLDIGFECMVSSRIRGIPHILMEMRRGNRSPESGGGAPAGSANGAGRTERKVRPMNAWAPLPRRQGTVSCFRDGRDHKHKGKPTGLKKPSAISDTILANQGKSWDAKLQGLRRTSDGLYKGHVRGGGAAPSGARSGQLCQPGC